MVKKVLICGVFAIGLTMLFNSCSNGKSKEQVPEKVAAQKPGLFDDIVEGYLELGEIEQKMIDKFQEGERGNVSKEEFGVFMQQMREKQESVKENIKEKLQNMGEKPFPVSASEAVGVTFSGSVLTAKGACPTIVNIKAKPSTSFSGPAVYAIFLDSDNQIVFKTIGGVRDDGRINVGYHINYMQSGRKPISKEEIKKYASIAKLMIVTKEEYKAGYVPAAATVSSSKAAVLEIPKHVLTSQGVGAITIDANINKLPKSIEGLYDKVTVKSEYNEVEDEKTTTATFTLKGKEVMTAMADDNGKIIYIGVSSKDVAVKIGDTYFQVGSSVKELLKAKGVKKDESYAAVYDGIQFNQDASGKIYDMSIGSAW